MAVNPYLSKAYYLIQNHYPVPTRDPLELAEILEKKAKDQEAHIEKYPTKPPERLI